jgi:hypothetical protein
MYPRPAVGIGSNRKLLHGQHVRLAVEPVRVD